ncbi:hypothetical protein Dgeo_2955 (plasmid) [Deinococcus geothermalis DSM 11300]|uniref:DUF302 domain-containing protein n=2 Tax=Deinococcus geothermalis TaxID=68909 RepID=A8ZR89_DEIGD|nr:hypothetical protein [Deinococcus sp. S9]ABW34998.1 hypothetical protein Dgeo_2955 [Deinococcus geothermalis DSM 11300]TDE84988.1 hypothetical protein E0686_14190 [Deinococcus sp. S9]
MNGHLTLALAAVFSVASAQTPNTVTGPGGYAYTPGMTPAQQQQLKARMDKLLAPPKLVGSGVGAAVTAVLNTQGLISGLVGPLPRELGEALNRAAIRTPVQLVLATQGVPATASLSRVKRVLLPTNSPTTMLATTDMLITVDAGRINVYQSAYLADQVHQNVQQIIDATAKAR